MHHKACGLFVALCLSTGLAGAQTPIVVHHIGPLTGVLAASNKESVDGARRRQHGFRVDGRRI